MDYELALKTLRSLLHWVRTLLIDFLFVCLFVCLFVTALGSFFS